MAQFRYEARDRSGKIKRGLIYAETVHEVHRKLRERGLRTISLEEKKETFWTKEIKLFQKVKLMDLNVFLRQFSTLIKAGVTIVEAIKTLTAQSTSKTLRKTLHQVEKDLREGTSLASSLKKHPNIFPSLLVNMVQAGEISGSLDETLEKMADYYDKQYRTRQKMKSALTYPIVVAVVSVIVVAFLLLFVIPTYVQLFAQIGGELPLITKMVVGSSKWLTEHFVLLIILAFLLFFSVYCIKNIKSMKIYLDYAILKLPLIGKLYHKAVLARFARTLSSLLANSVSILQAVALTENIVENEVVAKILARSRHALEQGASMTEPMAKHWVFPIFVIQMIAIGEKTGSLDYMLEKIADYYESEVETASDQLKSIIEPLLILIIAVIVGIIVLSVIVPMFQLFNNIQ